MAKREKWSISKCPLMYGGHTWDLTKNGDTFYVYVSGKKSFISRIARLLNEDDARKASKKKAKVKK
jgi:hypothetical protein